MLWLLYKIVLFRLQHWLGWPKVMPVNYTVSLLYNCNSRCRTCNVWKKKEKPLSLPEYEQLFRNLGKSPYWITFSGGEPFLRKDIADIVSLAYRYCKPAIINIPTNGMLTSTIIEQVTNICRACPRSSIGINVSLDNTGKAHDDIRGVKGNYEKTIKTFTELKRLNFDNLNVGIHSVISKFNVNGFAKTATTLMELNPDSYITEIAEQRHELDTMEADITPQLLSYKSAVDFLIHRIKHTSYRGMNRITQAFRVEYYNLVKKIMRDQTQVIPCYSGVASAQISPGGDVWVCCIKANSMGNLKQNGFDFKRIWFSKAMQAERKSIKNKQCFCPLANAAYTNMLLNIPIVMRVSWRALLRWWH